MHRFKQKNPIFLLLTSIILSIFIFVLWPLGGRYIIVEIIKSTWLIHLYPLPGKLLVEIIKSTWLIHLFPLPGKLLVEIIKSTWLKHLYPLFLNPPRQVKVSCPDGKLVVVVNLVDLTTIPEEISINQSADQSTFQSINQSIKICLLVRKWGTEWINAWGSDWDIACGSEW